MKVAQLLMNKYCSSNFLKIRYYYKVIFDTSIRMVVSKK